MKNKILLISAVILVFTCSIWSKGMKIEAIYPEELKGVSFWGLFPQDERDFFTKAFNGYALKMFPDNADLEYFINTLQSDGCRVFCSKYLPADEREGELFIYNKGSKYISINIEVPYKNNDGSEAMTETLQIILFMKPEKTEYTPGSSFEKYGKDRLINKYTFKRVYINNTVSSTLGSIFPSVFAPSVRKTK